MVANFLSRRNSSSSRRHCPVCKSGSENGCKPSTDIKYNNGAWWCRTHTQERVGTNINGYVCTKAGDAWGTWIPASNFKRYKRTEKAETGHEIIATAIAEKPKTAEELAQEEKERKLTEKRAKANPAEIVKSRHAEYLKLATRAPFNAKQKKNLTGRGLSEESIERLRGEGRLISINHVAAKSYPHIPGFAKQQGFLITARNLFGELVGAQVAPDSKFPAKYLWTKTGDKGQIPQTNHLDNGEIPLTIEHVVIDPNNQKSAIAFIEGFLKPIVFAEFLRTGEIEPPKGFGQIYVVGAAGGQFEQSCEQIEELTLFTGCDNFILIPDAGAFCNPSVLNSYIQLSQVVPALKYADWGQCWDKNKPDGDEAVGIKIFDELKPFETTKLLGSKMIRAGIFGQDAESPFDVRTVSPAQVKLTLKANQRVVIRPSMTLGASIYAPSAFAFLKAHGDFSKAIKNYAFSHKYLANKEFEYLCTQNPQIVIEDEQGRLIPYVFTIRRKQWEKLEKHEFNAKYNADYQPLFEATQQEGNAIALRSSLGTGKTTLVKKALKEEQRLLAITSRNKLGEQFAGTVNAATQRNASQSEQIDRLVTTVASLKESAGYLSALKFANETVFNTFTDKNSVIVIDEIESVLNDLINSKTNGKGRKEKIKLLIDLIQNAKQLLMLDGNFHPWTINLLQRVRKDLHLFDNLHANMEGRKIYKFETQDKAAAMMVKMILKGHRIAAAIDIASANKQKIDIESIAYYLRKGNVPKEEVAIVTAFSQLCEDHSSYDINPDDLGKYRVVLYTSIWESGVSIPETEKFDAVFGFFSGINTADICYQMLNRVRHNCPRYVYAQRASAHSEKISDESKAYLKEILSQTCEDLLEKEAIAGNDLGEENPIITAIVEAFEQEVDVKPNSAIKQWEDANQIYQAACAASYRESIFGLAQLAGYKLVDESEIFGLPDAAQIAEFKNKRKEYVDFLQDRYFSHVVYATPITHTRFLEIQKGASCKMEEEAAAFKHPVEHDTNNAVTITTIDEAKTHKNTRKMKGVNASHAIADDNQEQLKEQRGTAIVKSDRKRNYLKDNEEFTEAYRVEWINNHFGKYIRQLLALQKLDVWSCNRDKEGVFVEMVKTFEEKREEYNRVFGRHSTGKDPVQAMMAMVQWAGFEILRKKVNTGTSFQIKIPDLTQRIIDYRNAQKEAKELSSSSPP